MCLDIFELDYLLSIQTTKDERKFAEYCMKKIEDDINNRNKSSSINFRESSAMQKLYIYQINKIYNLLECYWFNEKDIGLNFVGYNNGTIIDISYLTINTEYSNQYEYRNNVEKLLHHYNKLILDSNDHTSINIKIPDIGGFTGFLFHFIFYEVKYKLIETLNYELYMHPNGWQLRYKN
jgi:hypothetical protein